jgi:hypothetical protein
VTGAVDVRVVAVLGGVLNVCRRDGDTTLALLRGLVNGAILEIFGEALGCLALRDGCCEGGLRLLAGEEFVAPGAFYFSVIDVTDGT